MIVTIFGANGKVGRLVVAEALTRGHSVRAFCHRTSKLADHPQLQICHGDIYDTASVEAAVAGADAVISALGSWGTPLKNILATGVSAIIPSMHLHHVGRIVSLTGADARGPGDNISLVHLLTHRFLAIFTSKVLYDGEEHIRLLAATNLDWTVLRSPPMLPLGRGKHFKLSDRRPLPWQTIPRQAVALALVDLVESSEQSRSAPYITRGKP